MWFTFLSLRLLIVANRCYIAGGPPVPNVSWTFRWRSKMMANVELKLPSQIHACGFTQPKCISHPGSTPLTNLTVGWPVGSANCHILLRESAKFVCLQKCHGEKTTVMEIRCVENVWNISQSVSCKWSS